MWSKITPYIWDNYKVGEVPSNLKLWAKVWQNLWEDERNHYYHRFEPISLRVVLTQVIDDIHLSILTEKSIVGIKAQLNSKLKYARSLDSIATKLLSVEIGHLIQLINNTKKDESHFDEIVQLSRYLIDRLNDERHFDKIFVELKELIFNNQNPDIHDLKIISQLLIDELVQKGFTLHTIMEIPDNLFNKGRIEYYKNLPVFKGKYFGTNIDFNIEADTPILEKFNFLKQIYTAPKFRAKAIFLILGATSKQNERIKIGRIEFQPMLNIEGKSEDGKSLWVFTSLEEQERNKPFLRASMNSEGVDCFKLLSEARRETQRATDFLKYLYNYSKTGSSKVNVSKSWALLDSTEQVMHQMPDLWEGLPKYKSYYEGIDLISRQKDHIQFIEKQGKIFGLEHEVLSNNRIYQALHWVHKAQKSKHIEDYFMNFWIALEYLVRTNREKVIESVLGSVLPICLNDFFNDLQQNLYDLLQSQISNGFLTVSDDQLASKYWLWRKIGECSWSTKQFCQDIPEIKKYVQDRYVFERASEIQGLKQDKEKLLNLMRQMKESLKYELLTIYRIRNKIVHSAEYEHEYILHYAVRLSEIVNSVLQRIMFYLQYFPERSIDDILTRLRVINELFYVKLENDPDFDVHDYKFFT